LSFAVLLELSECDCVGAVAQAPFVFDDARGCMLRVADCVDDLPCAIASRREAKGRLENITMATASRTAGFKGNNLQQVTAFDPR
jgi:hypothetical protein